MSTIATNAACLLMVLTVSPLALVRRLACETPHRFQRIAVRVGNPSGSLLPLAFRCQGLSLSAFAQSHGELAQMRTATLRAICEPGSAQRPPLGGSNLCIGATAAISSQWYCDQNWPVR
jgi:hypothetical protein